MWCKSYFIHTGESSGAGSEEGPIKKKLCKKKKGGIEKKKLVFIFKKQCLIFFYRFTDFDSDEFKDFSDILWNQYRSEARKLEFPKQPA